MKRLIWDRLGRSALLLVLVWLALGPTAGAEPEQPKQQPPWQGVVLTDLAGKKVVLDSLLARGPVLINFWATWCGPCRLEMPSLEKIYQEMRLKGITFAAVSLDRRVSREALEGFLKSRAFSVPVYRDEDGSVAKRFGVVSIPMTVVLRPSGEVFHHTKGYRPGDEVLLKKKLEELIAPAAATAGAGGGKP